MGNVITLTTDFGTRDGYVAAMKGVILGIAPMANLVDVSHEVAPQDVAGGAYLLAAVCRFFPRGTVHLVVIDPGVGTTRRGLAARAGGHLFVAPDNGVLAPVLEASADVEIVSLTNAAYWLDEVSPTFHGRDLFAPVAAHLAAGVPLVEAMDSVAGATGNIIYEEAVYQMRDQVATGQQLQLVQCLLEGIRDKLGFIRKYAIKKLREKTKGDTGRSQQPHGRQHMCRRIVCRLDRGRTEKHLKQIAKRSVQHHSGRRQLQGQPAPVVAAISRTLDNHRLADKAGQAGHRSNGQRPHQSKAESPGHAAAQPAQITQAAAASLFFNGSGSHP